METNFKMTISLNVLNHLGLNLYSNVPAVLSEAVANAWDADAEHVDITLSTSGQIIVQDDGHGMSATDINDRYLHVGFERRKKKETSRTPKFERRVMGRKGIGKLALFSIAETVDVYTVKDGEKNALRMSLPDIRDSIDNPELGNVYHPDSLDTDDIDWPHGTRIILSNLKNQYMLSDAIRRRLARRFSIIGANNHFQVSVDGIDITIEDRRYFQKVQYIWAYGERGQEIVQLAQNLEQTEFRNGLIDMPSEDSANSTKESTSFTVEGWIGSVKQAGDLKDREINESLNKIVIMVRGKLAQEDVLEEFGEGGIYAKYLIGELHADFLDDDNEEDIATTSRQRIVEHDPRYTAMKKWLGLELKNIQRQWTELRTDDGMKQAMTIPAIDTWFKTLQKSESVSARRLFGSINQHAESDAERRTLLKNAVVAFESLRYKHQLDKWDKISLDNMDVVAEAFGSLDEIEAALYYQIVKERIQVVEKLQNQVDKNALERIVQLHLFDHLWLLDPSWERATVHPEMESTVAKIFADVSKGLTKEQQFARLDIRYKSVAGKHVIIELKRPGRRVQIWELMEQIDKYLGAFRRALSLQNPGREEPIEFVCLLGEPLKNWDDPKQREEDLKVLSAKNARIVFYQELVRSAYDAYRQYTERKHEAGRVYELLQTIDADIPDNVFIAD